MTELHARLNCLILFRYGLVPCSIPKQILPLKYIFFFWFSILWDPLSHTSLIWLSIPRIWLYGDSTTNCTVSIFLPYLPHFSFTTLTRHWLSMRSLKKTLSRIMMLRCLRWPSFQCFIIKHLKPFGLFELQASSKLYFKSLNTFRDLKLFLQFRVYCLRSI